MTASEKEAAKVCGYSVSYFSKLFNHTFGQSFRDRLLKVRLDHAVKLLLTTDMNITSLSSAAGFSSVSYFIKRFRESYGMSPKNTFHRLTANTVSCRYVKNGSCQAAGALLYLYYRISYLFSFQMCIFESARVFLRSISR